MADNSKIEWCDATWNCVVGCSLESPGCTHCYAMRQAWRLEHAFKQDKYRGTTEKVKGVPVWTGLVRLDEASLDWPLRWKGAKAARTERRPSRIFVNSMSDLFHPDLPDADIDRVLAVSALSPHVLQVLTKRPERMRAYFGPSDELNGMTRDCLVEGEAQSLYQKRTGEDPSMWLAVHWPIKNLWLGTSVEDRARKSRIDALRETPAAVRFLSLEPLLEDLGELDLRGIHWVIVGGESGPGAREMHVDWMRSIVRQCRAAGVPCMVKQLGARPLVDCSDMMPVQPEDADPADIAALAAGLGNTPLNLANRKGGNMAEWPSDLRVREFPH